MDALRPPTSPAHRPPRASPNRSSCGRSSLPTCGRPPTHGPPRTTATAPPAAAPRPALCCEVVVRGLHNFLCVERFAGVLYSFDQFSRRFVALLDLDG